MARFLQFQKTVFFAPWWLLLFSLLSDSSCLGQSTVHWELTAYGRRAALADPGQEQPGFEEMNPDSTGLSFVNPLEQSYNDLNQNLVGSGPSILGDHGNLAMNDQNDAPCFFQHWIRS